MVSYRYPIIAREAWLIIGVIACLSVVVQYFAGAWVATPVWLLMLLVSYLFRDPGRLVPPKPLAVVSPSDGKVVAIEEMADPYLDGDETVVQIQLRMSVSDVYSIRSPMEGKVLKQWLPQPDSPEFTEKPGSDRFAQWVQSDEQDDVVLAFKPTAVFHWPHCYVHSGERIGQGQRCGIVPFGAIVEVYIPKSARIEVKVGDVVHAGSDSLATLVHSY